MKNIELCKEIWQKINNTPSKYPDIEKDYVFDIMVHTLAENGNDSLSYDERWVLAYLSIAEKVHIYTICDKYVCEYVSVFDNNGEEKTDELFENEENLKEKKIQELLNNLILGGVIEKEGKYIKLKNSN